jgi:hypothetical protein
MEVSIQGNGGFKKGCKAQSGRKSFREPLPVKLSACGPPRGFPEPGAKIAVGGVKTRFRLEFVPQRNVGQTQ